MNKIIIADAGPLIAFGQIKRLTLIIEIFGKIIAPAFVLDECLANLAQKGAKEISEAINKKIIEPYENPNMDEYQDIFAILGKGEASAIILASQLNAPILIDEKLGRKVAEKKGLNAIGTAGVLLLAKKKKLIEKVIPVIAELKTNGYYFSKELIQTVLTLANEKM